MRVKLFRILLFMLLGAFSAKAQQPRLIQPEGHTGEVDFLSYSPDGKYIVTASHSETDKKARVWERSSGKLLFAITEILAEIDDVQYTPDGKYIYILAGAPALYNPQNGKREILVDSLKTRYANLSPDGQFLAYSLNPFPYKIDSVYIWNIKDKQLMMRLGGEKYDYDYVQFSPDGRLLFAYTDFAPFDKTIENYEEGDTSYSSKITIWSFPEGKKLLDKTVPHDLIKNATFNNRSNILAIQTFNSLVAIDIKTSEQINTTGDFSHYENISFEQTDSIIYASDFSRLSILNLSREGDIIKTLDHFKNQTDPSGDEMLSDYKISNDRQFLYTLDRSGLLKKWNTRDYAFIEERKLNIKGLRSFVSSLNFSFSPGEDQMAVYGYGIKTAPLFQKENPNPVQLLKGSNSEIHSFFFLKDTSLLAIYTIDRKLKLVDAKTGRQVKLISLDKYNDMQEYIPVDNGSKLLIHSGDSSLYLLDMKTGKEIYTVTAGSAIYRLAVNEQQQLIATYESLADLLCIWNLQTGKLIAKQKIIVQSYGYSIQFTGDGSLLLFSASDKVQVRNAKNGLLVKTLSTGIRAGITDIAVHKNTVVATADSLLFAWDITTGKNLWTKKNTAGANWLAGLNLPSFESPLFSPDGKQLAVISSDRSVKLFNTETGHLVHTLDGVHYLSYSIRVNFSQSGDKLLSWQPFGIPVLWDLKTGVAKKAYTTDYYQGSSRAVMDDANQYVATASGGSLNFYDFETGKFLYSTLPVNENDWINVDSSFRYDGTDEARKLLYFTCGTEVIELEQVKDQLWVPGLAERIVNGETIGSKGLSQLDICGVTPRVEDKSGSTGYRFHITPQKGGLGETVLLVNSIEIKRFSPAQLTKKETGYELSVSKEEIKDFLVSGQQNLVSVKAYTEGNKISSRGLVITDSSSKKNVTAPNLYAVMVGVSDYKGDELDLKFAAKDATDIAGAIANAAKKLLNADGKEHVFVYNLTTAKDRYLLPEKSNIKNILEEIGTKATANDILMIFFAGHGVMEGEQKQFYFLTADASSLAAGSSVTDVGISTAELTDWMKPQNIKAQKRILIFDACNSGQAIKDFVKMGNDNQNYLAARNDDNAQQIKAIDKLNEKSGLFILSASASNQSAYEMGRYSQGLLTYSLLKAIKQQPDILEDGKYLNVSRWFNAAEKTVSELAKETGARQEPQVVANTNFNIGIVDNEVIARINLPTEKPLFAASNFQNSDEAIADDDLEISKTINLQLSDLATRGTDSKIVYVTATNSPDAYSLSGRYTLKSGIITMTVNLKQNKSVKTKFVVSGTKDKLTDIAAEVVRKATEMIR